MKQSIAMRWLLAYSGALTVAVCAFLLTGAAAPGKRASFEEIDVQRINVREPDGTLRLVVSNRTRFPGLIFRGKEHRHPREVAGMLFYNDEGTENGGLVFGGSRGPDGEPRAGGHFSFDQYEQDQVATFGQYERDGIRWAGVTVLDQPDGSSEPMLENLEELNALPPDERQKRQVELTGGPANVARVFLGKDHERSSLLSLRDAEGRVRLVLRVAADGAAAVEFMDEAGKVVRRLTPEDITAQ